MSLGNADSDPLSKASLTFKTRIAMEIGTTPLQVLFGGISAIAGSLSLYIAWRTGGPSFAAPIYPLKGPNSSGYLVSLAALITILNTAAMAGRFTRRSSWIAAYFGSLIYACIGDFLITLVIRTQGVRFGLVTDQPAATLWLIYAASLIIFAAVNGERLKTDILAYEQRSATRVQGQDVTVGDVAFSLTVIVIVWAVLLRVGSNALVTGLI